MFDVQPQIMQQNPHFYFKPNRSGNVQIYARIRDDGGTDNGGDDQSDPQFFNVTINPEDNPDFIFSVSGSILLKFVKMILGQLI